MLISISVIIPFYKGNKYLKRLIFSIENVAKKLSEKALFEIILVNDSPENDIECPETLLKIEIIENEKNLGIQGARVVGLNHAKGEWILFLDQDDELVTDGFENQIELTRTSDVVVGNGIYNLGKVNKKIFDNQKNMEYLISEEKFIQIRNLIPSPGECLIRKDKIPRIWTENRLKINGADDWFLWLLLFKKKCKFSCNSKAVYIHNDSNGENLSANLIKMKESAIEAMNILYSNCIINEREFEQLNNAIMFKYYQDTNQLSIWKILRYIKPFIDNVKYRLTLNLNKKGK